MLNIGDTAPAFAAEDQNGKTVRLADLKGKNGGSLFLPQGPDARLHGGGLRF
jgi:peroxiredoxin